MSWEEKYDALASMIEGYRHERNEAQARVVDAALIHADLVRERDEARAEAASSLAMARIAGDKHDQKCAEVDVLRGVGCEEDGDGSCGVCRKCAYRRGAEAMRDAAANALDMAGQGTLCDTSACDHWGRYVRALPIPEEP
jgi:hypothetical protein